MNQQIQQLENQSSGSFLPTKRHENWKMETLTNGMIAMLTFVWVIGAVATVLS